MTTDFNDAHLGDDPQTTTYAGDGDHNLIANPKPQDIANRKYPDQTDLENLFFDSANTFVRSDGYVSLNIKGTVVDFTQSHIAKE